MNHTDQDTIIKQIKAQPVQKLVRRGWLAGLGVVGLVYDKTEQTFQQLVERGSAAQAQSRQELSKVQQQANKQLGGLATRLLPTRQQLTSLDQRIADLTEQVAQLAATEEQDGPEIYSRIAQPTAESELAAPAHLPLAIRPTASLVPAPEEAAPFEGYDQMRASDVVKRLAELDPMEWERIREYEQAHQQRVTVLREITRLETATHESE